MTHLRAFAAVLGAAALLCLAALALRRGPAGGALVQLRGDPRRLGIDTAAAAETNSAQTSARTTAPGTAQHSATGAAAGAAPALQPLGTPEGGADGMETGPLVIFDGNFSLDEASVGESVPSAQLAGCPYTRADWSSLHHGGARCFCQLAQNPACRNMGCGCGSTCHRSINYQGAATTFLNLRTAHGCSRREGLLTIPRSYYRDIRHLRDGCSNSAELLAYMLRQGFSTYRNWYGSASVMQCIHASRSVSVPWLHLHTFCSGGSIDGMPTSSRVALCMTMNSEQDAHNLAHAYLAWAH